MANLFSVMPIYWMVTLSSVVSKVVTAVVQIVVIKYLLSELGVDLFSIYSLLAGLAAWALLTDFGVGYSLQNFISEQRANARDIGRYIASAIMVIVPLLLIMTLIVVALSPWLSSLYLKGDLIFSTEQKARAFLVASLIFIISSVGGIAYKVLFAEQKGWMANIYTAAGWVIGLTSLYVYSISGFELSVLTALIFFYSPSALFASYALCRLVFIYREYFFVCDSLSIAKSILRRSVSFWLFAILSTIVLQADYLVMSQKLGPKQITEYIVLLKIFGLSTFLYLALLQALWPVCAELRAEGRWEELKVFINRYLKFAMVSIFAFTFLLILFRSRIFYLIDESLQISPVTLLLFGFYFLTRAWTDTYAVLLQSMNLLKPFWYLVPIQAIFSIGLQWWLADKYGVDGLVLGLTLSFLATVSFGLPYKFYSEIKSKLKQNEV